MNKNLTKTALSIALTIGLALQASAFASTKTGKINTDGVNVREKATTEASIVTTINKGDKVSVTGSDGQWFKISINGKSGYIREDMLYIVDSAQSDSQKKESPKQEAKSSKNQNSDLVGKTVLCTTPDLNLRSEPSTSSAVLKTIPSDVKLKVKDANGEWLQVSYSSVVGYVRSDKVKVVAAQKQETQQQEAKQQEAPPAEPKQADINVSQAQTLLTELKFYTGKIDGNMGTRSLSAVKSFQRAYGTNIDGKVGTETLAIMQQAVENGGNGSSIGEISIKEDVYLAEWFNYMKYNFPNNTSLRCVDVETGEEFFLRAFSIGNHADVETTTQKDTDILRRINGNKWTWTPRAIWVYINDKCYAAAINVMPHGGGVVKDNGMNGQICMHFLHSRQHNTGQENRNLQAAILLSFENAISAPKVGAAAGQGAGAQNNFEETTDDVVNTQDESFEKTDET